LSVFLVEYFNNIIIIIIIIIITMAKNMQLLTFMEENGGICLDSGNVTMLLTYCDSKAKSEHWGSSKSMNDTDLEDYFLLRCDTIQSGRQVLRFWGNLLPSPPTQ
jgi:hypothetical protein